MDWEENEERESAEAENSGDESDDGDGENPAPSAARAAPEAPPVEPDSGRGKGRGRRGKGEAASPTMMLRLPRQQGGHLEVEAEVLRTYPDGRRDLRPRDARLDVHYAVQPVSADNAEGIHYRPI